MRYKIIPRENGKFSYTIPRMRNRNLLQKIPLTEQPKLQTLVENRRIFNLQNCELNVFESYEESYRVPLTFPDFVITSMVRGKKIMHLRDKPAFDYLPGESVIVPANETMLIDFPEATADEPSQCIALAVDGKYIHETVNYLNEFYNDGRDRQQWQLQFNQYHFDNDDDVTALINKIIRICSSTQSSKNIYADLSLKELLIRLIQDQHLVQVQAEAGSASNQSRMHFTLHYIHEHLGDKIAIDVLSRKACMSRNMFFKWFRDQFGITPLDYINRERIRMAKQLLHHQRMNVSEVCFQCGFSDVNYFIRIFKKQEGVTPGVYQQHCR